MKKLALIQLLLLPITGIVYDVTAVAADGGAQSPPPSAACNPWSLNYWGDVTVTTQAEADEYSCFRRIVGSLTVVHSSAAPIRLPKMRAVLGDLKVVFRQPITSLDRAQALHVVLSSLEDVSGTTTLSYPRDDRWWTALSGRE